MAANVFLVLTALSVAASIIAFLKSRGAALAERCLFGLVPMAVFQCLAAVICKFHDAPYSKWNEARLANVFGLRLGVPVYPGRTGVITSYVCGPMGLIAYLPATLGSSPTSAMLLGAGIAMLITFAPALWLVFRAENDETHRSRWLRIGMFCIFVFFTLWNDALAYSMYYIHFDAPALGLGALACCTLVSNLRQKHWKYFLTALLAALSVWSKQPLAPLFVALPLYLLLSRGRKEAFILTAYLVAVGLAVSGVMVWQFGPFSNLFFCMFEIPSRVPWAPNKLGVLLGIWERIQIPLAVYLFLYLHERWSGNQAEARKFFANSDAALFFLAGLCNIPTSFMGVVKIGGDINNYSFAVYFLSLAGLLSFKQALVARLNNAHIPTRVLAVVVLAVACSIFISGNYRYIKDQYNLYDNPAEQAFEYEKAHPNEAYFPWNPLVHILAEGRYYNFDWGVYDRYLADLPLSDAEYRRGIPPSFKYIIFPEPRPSMDPTPSLWYLQKEYSVESASPKHPGWQIFHRPASAPVENPKQTNDHN
jgi:hypothetical protein